MKNSLTPSLLILLGSLAFSQGGLAQSTAATANRPPPPPGPALPPPVRGPSLEAAQELARSVIDLCGAKGEHPSTVSVTDSSGKPKVLLVPDNKAFSNTATLKAATSVAFKATTADLEERVKTDKDLASRLEANKEFVAHGGARPLIVNGEVIGAVAVAGADHVIGDACVAEAVAGIQRRLK